MGDFKRKRVIVPKKHQNTIRQGIWAVELQSPRNPVIPVQAGIQSKDVNLVFLDSRLRRGGGKFYISLPILLFAVLLFHQRLCLC